MDSQIARLLDAIDNASRQTHANVVELLRGLPEPASLPTPWETWTLIGLVRHRDRQNWVRNMILTRLQCDTAALAARGALGGHPQGVKRTGSLPGTPEWEYDFHGRGCCLTHKVTGETIDVDFWDDSAEFFDVFFYVVYLKSLRTPEAAEQRLLELHRSVDPIRIAMKRLHAAGAMIPLSDGDSHPLRISEEVLAYSNAIEAFCLAWEEPANRVVLAALIGDWIAAHEAADGQPEIQMITGPQADECRAIRWNQLEQETGSNASEALIALAGLGEVDQQLEAAFRSPPSSLISAALDIAGEKNDPKWCASIYSLFRRVTPEGSHPEPLIWLTSLKFLFRHGYQREELTAALADTEGPVIGDAVLLALENAPQHAFSLIRRGLASDIRCNRITVAAVLALIAQPWSMRELMRALQESDDQQKTVEARAALLESCDPQAEIFVLAWEEKNPHEPEAGHFLEIDERQIVPLYSMAEHDLKNAATFLRFEMNSLHNQVRALRDVMPHE